jgi:hypothetical protein
LELERFFREYASASLESPSERLPAFYAASFIVGGPTGSAAFKNDGKFVEWLGELHKFNQQTGMISMEVLGVEQLSPLSSRHVLANVDWGARFRRTGDRVIAFRIAYLLEKTEDTWKILAYIAEKDQEQEMRELGLV